MQKQSIKKISITAAAIAAVIAIAITFGILCNWDNVGGLNYSETFTGYISESAYSSRESAARAFVTEQLSGAAGDPEYMSCDVLSKMSNDNVDKLNVTASAARSASRNIVGGDNCEVTYKVSGGVRRIKMDALYTENGDYLYGVRLPENGEQPTKAYMDSVMDGNKYLNCTATSRIGIAMLGVYNTYLQTIKFADDSAYFGQELPGFINEIYLRENGNGITAYLKNPDGDGDDNFYTVAEINSMLYKKGLELEPIYLTKGGTQVKLSSLSCMADVTEFAFMMPIDCSYFVKTDYGFAMTDDKFKAVCVSIAGKDFANEFDKFWHDYKVNFHADYYVSEGRLSRLRLVLQMAYDGDIMSIVITSDYTEFGTTEVVVPHD